MTDSPFLRPEEIRLDPMRFAGQFRVTDEMQYRMDRYCIEQFYELETRNTVTRIERDVHVHRLLAETEKIPFRETVPWAVLIPIVIPRTWWQRLLGRKHEYRWKQIRGEVVVRGEVAAQVTDGRAFPDAPTYPAELGRPIVYRTVEPLWDRYTDAVSRADYPHVRDDGRDFDHLGYDPQDDPEQG